MDTTPPTTPPERHALLIVDLQHDFVAADGAYARGGVVSADVAALPARIAPLARALAAAGGLVVASRFTLWPDARGEPMVAPHLLALRPFLKRGDFAPGSRGHGVVELLAPHVHMAVDKVAYSAFFQTQLDWVLRHAGIERLSVCGIVTNGGVASTVREAHLREYTVEVLADGCAALAPGAHDAALADLRTVAAVGTIAEALARLSAGG
jgi:ureidoacrylate peracid hydrolase